MTRLDIPSTWEITSLGELASFEMGQAPAGSASNFDGNGTVFVKAGEFGAPYPIVREWTTEPKKFARKGDVLICVVGATAGKLNLGIDCAIGRSVAAIRPDDGVSQKMVYYQLLPRVEEMRAGSVGSAQGVISQADLSRFSIYLPPSAEQARIVEKLEELLSDLDAGVAELKAAQRKLAQYRRSLLKTAVEGALTADWRAAHGKPKETGAELLQRILSERRARWEQKQLAKFAEQRKTPPKGWQAKYPEPVSPDLTDLQPLPEGWIWASVEQVASDEAYALAIGPFGSNLVVSDYRSEGVPLIFVRNIRARTYGGKATKFVTPQKAEELKAHHVAAGDVLVTKMGEPPGDADVYPEGQPTAVITADCIKIRPQLGVIDPNYLSFVINSPLGSQQIKPMTQGVAQKKVSLGRFSSFAVPLPPTKELDVIVGLLETSFASVRAQETAVEYGLKQAAAQRKNLLKTAFAGQLVPQDSNDEPASELLARIRAARVSNDGDALRRRRKSA